MNLFDMNGPLMYNLGKLANIFLCNVLFCLFSLPLFTIGASLSALYACMQAIWKDDEDDIIAKQFWNAFKRNFGQGTALWFICLLAFAFLGIYYFIIASMTGLAEKMYRVSFFMMCLIFLFGFQYLFPLQARYENHVKNTLKNAAILAFVNLPRTILMMICYALPLVIVYFSTYALLFVFLFGISAPAYGAAFIYSGIFKKLEPETEEAASDLDFSLKLDEDEGNKEING